MQLHHDGSSLNQVQLLPQNLLITVCTVRLAKPGHQETFLVVENTEGEIISGKANAHEGHQDSAHQQNRAVGNPGTHAQNAQYSQNHTENTIALAGPDSQTGAVLGFAPEYFVESPVHQIAQTEHTAGCQ